MIKILFTAALIATTTGYDFRDKDFNQFLADEISENSDPNILRFRRDTEAAAPVTPASDCDCHHDHHHHHHGRWRKDMHCCKEENFDPKIYENFHDTKLLCEKEIRGTDDEISYDPFDCEKILELKQQTICIGECIAKKFNFIDEKGAVKRDALVNHIKTQFASIAWKLNVTDNVIDKCLEEIATMPADTTLRCNPSSLRMVHCMWKGFIKNCPAEMQTQSNKCNKLREKIEKGDSGYLKRVHLHRFIHHHHHDHEHDHNDHEHHGHDHH